MEQGSHSDYLQQPQIGPYRADYVTCGDALDLVEALPDGSIDIVVTSPPYWGQRESEEGGIGNEEDPRRYVDALAGLFEKLLAKLTDAGVVWLNAGDSYNTGIGWRPEDRAYSTLGDDRQGLAANNSAYTKNRAERKPYIGDDEGWLRYGNLLALPYRLVVDLCERGYLFRGEVVWSKVNALPEGKARRPHRQHEAIYLLSKSEKHSFRITPPVGTVWEMASDRLVGRPHYSRFPIELPKRCIEAYGRAGREVVVLDPFAGSGSTGLATLALGCTFVGFEIDPDHARAANQRLSGDVPLALEGGAVQPSLFGSSAQAQD